MSYPKIKFLSSLYLRKFLGTTSDFDKLLKFKFSFKKYFKKYEKRILKYIEKYSGLRWTEKEITVWLFDGHYPSISFPLLLNVYGMDKEFTLFSLIHELVHNIMLFKIKVTKEKSKEFNLIELEAITQLITKYVAKNFFNIKKLEELCKKCEFGGYYKHIWKREQELENKWNLESHPFTYFVEKNKNYLWLEVKHNA